MQKIWYFFIFTSKHVVDPLHMFSWGNKKKYLSGYMYHMTLVTLCIVRVSRAKLSANVPAGCKM